MPVPFGFVIHKPTDRLTDRKTDRQTDRQTVASNNVDGRGKMTGDQPDN